MQIFRNRLWLICISVFLIISSGCVQSPNNDVRKQSDVLLILYLCGDANNGDNFFPTLQQAEDALTFIRNENDTAKQNYKSVNIVALWDGPDITNDGIHSESQTRLLVLGRGFHDYDNDGTDSGKYGSNKIDWSLSSNTYDFSSTVNWINYGKGQELNMASPQTLTNYLIWVNTYFHGNEVVLFFGGHGIGPAVEENIENNTWYNSRSIIYDTDTNGESGAPALRICDVISSLEASGYTGTNRPDLIVEDLCYGGSLEEVYGLKNAARYLLASPNLTYGNSMGIYTFITNFTKNKSLETICREEVDNFAKKWPFYEKEYGSSTFTLADLSKEEEIEKIKNSVSLLAEKLLSDPEKYKDVINTIQKTYDNSGLIFEGYYVYLKETGWLLNQIENYSSFPELKEYTEPIKQNLSKVIISSFASARYYTGHQGEKFTCYSMDKKKSYSGTYAAGDWYGLSISITQQTAIRDSDKKTVEYERCTSFGNGNKWGQLIRLK